jgi:hypothetical protein
MAGTDPKTGQAIFGGSYGVGFNNVGSYQASAKPYIKSDIDVHKSSSATSDATEIIFPKVTKFITVQNNSTSSNNELRLAFASGGLGSKAEVGTANNYIKLAQSASFSADYRITKLYLIGESAGCTATVVAGLTQINASHLPDSWAGDDGVGGT